jgi:hypothetical protein
MKAILILSILSAIYSQKFLFQLATKAPTGITDKVIKIARDLGAGCGNDSDGIDCVFPTIASLDQGNKSLTKLGISFEYTEKYGNTIVLYTSYESEDEGHSKITIRLCVTSYYEYYFNKIDDKLSILDDEICRDSPSDCMIKKSEACDDSDCLEVPKKVFAAALNLTLLNQSKQLFPDATAKANYAKIVPAFSQLRVVLEKDALSSRCKAILPDNCMGIIVEKGTASKPDKIRKIPSSEINGYLNGCK